MKLGQGISWLLGNLQRSLFPQLEECWNTALTDKEQQLVSILEMIHLEKHVPWSAEFKFQVALFADQLINPAT